jgi:hypothetical protein
MHLFKFSFLLSLLLVALNVFSFSGNECLNSNFQLSIVHKGKPFGLSVVNLKIVKEDCTINVYQDQFKYLKQSWSVDVCRAPIHIKKSGGADVLKKVRECTKKSDDDFCLSRKKMMAVIQDDGLIFSEGEKERISSVHGKAYCAYLLLGNYLDESRVFNRGQDYSNLFESGYTAKEESSSTKSEETTVVPRPIVEGAQDDTPEVLEQEVSTEEEDKPSEKPKGVGTF